MGNTGIVCTSLSKVVAWLSPFNSARRATTSTLVAAWLAACCFPGGASAGPVVLMGIDAEDFNVSQGGHGGTQPYIDVLGTPVDGFLDKVTNAGTGILVIGGGKSPTDHVTTFWEAVGAGVGESVSFVNGSADIGTQSFDGFKMIAVASSLPETEFGGLEQAENDAFAARAQDVAAFINAGGGLIGLSQVGLSNPYGYLSLFGTFVSSFPSGGYDNITATAAGLKVGITSSNLDVCCWHDEYLTFPDAPPAELKVLATNPSTGNAAAIGGPDVTVGECKIAPATDFNLVGGQHTVVATVVDDTGVPREGLDVTFVVSAGPNAGDTSTATTDVDGNAMFAYTGDGGAGVDEIVASFLDTAAVPPVDVSCVPDIALKFWDTDCQPNGVPDTCDTGCDKFDNRCDFPGCGESADSDNNNVPDECSVCGNDLVEVGEECDSSVDDLCPDLCLPPSDPAACTCDLPCGDDSSSLPCVVTVDDPPGAYDDLQDAIDAANDGATITVEGTCRGPIDVIDRSGLTIQGIEPAGGCGPFGPRPSDLTSTVRKGRHTIKVTGSDNITVRYLNLIGARSENLEFKRSTDGVGYCNCFAESRKEGVELDGGGGHMLMQNLAKDNGRDGINLDETELNTVVFNTSRNNEDDGIELQTFSQENTVGMNYFLRNQADGIELHLSDRNCVHDNVVLDNGEDFWRDYGIQVRESDNNGIHNNVVLGNVDGNDGLTFCHDGSQNNSGNNVAVGCGTQDPPACLGVTSTSTTTVTLPPTTSTTVTTVTTTTTSTTTTTVPPDCECDVTWTLTNQVTLGALQFETDYSMAQPGTFDGVGEEVDCTALVGQFSAFNHVDTEQKLIQATITLAGFTGVIDVARCTYLTSDPTIMPADFAVTVVDASTPDLNPTTAEVEVTDIACTCSGVPGTTTTLPPPPGSCPNAPSSYCKEADKGRLSIVDKAGEAKDKLVWSWRGGAETTASELGDPTGTTDYALCVYDSIGGAADQRLSLEVAAGSNWHGSQTSPTLIYKDTSGTADGVYNLRVTPGAAGNASAKLKAKGAGLRLAGAAGANGWMRQDPDVTVQLHNAAGTCWTSRFASASKNDGGGYKAKAR